MAKADGTYLRELAQIQRQDVIILDDFGLQALDNHNRITLLEIIEDRHNRFYHCHLANTSSGMVSYYWGENHNRCNFRPVNIPTAQG